MQNELAFHANLYLARIYLVLTPEYYVIDRVKALPFEQSIVTPLQAQSLLINHPPVTSQTPAALTGAASTAPAAERTSAGSAEVVIPEGAKKGKYYDSRPVPHLLGPGSVFVTAGTELEGQVAFGSVFQDEIGFEWGVLVDTAHGLFTIRVKLGKNRPAGTLRFRWQASRLPEETKPIKSAISLYPNIHYAARFETVAFEARSADEACPAGELTWSVHPEKGGRISDAGVFTASDCSGIYEIRAESVVSPGQHAAAFVVIH